MSAILPDPELTFLEALELRAARAPERTAFHEVTFADRQPRARALSFEHMRELARAAASDLAARGVVPGDRVLLALDRAELFLAHFTGALMLGAIPVPLPAPGEVQAPVLKRRIDAIAADCAPRALVYLGADGSALGDTAELVVIDASRSATAAPASAPAFRRAASETAFIQYTSGSTGTPKGVVVTQANLVANLRASTLAAGFDGDDRSYSWLPLFHDMGLVGGLLLGIYLGIPTFVASPRSFLRRPDSWLRAIDAFRITFSVGPNFAYNLLARRMPEPVLSGLDLSSWRLAFDGSEPVDRGTIEAFVERFSSYGFRKTAFYPVYGLAECTLAAAFPEPGSAPDFDVIDREALARSNRAEPVPDGTPNAVSFVSVGRALPGHELRIVEPGSENALPPRRVGEIVFSGPSVTPGYFGAVEHDGARRELRTGDLGYLAGHRLYVVDRLKDLIILGGNNFAPADVERVATVDGVRPAFAVAFSRPSPHGTEELVLVVSLEATARGRADAIRTEIQRRLFAEFGVVAAEISMVKPAAIPKTSSGKLRRAECRRLHAAGALGAAANADETQQ